MYKILFELSIPWRDPLLYQVENGDKQVTNSNIYNY